MIALPSDAVPLWRFIEVLEKHGVIITDLGNGQHRLRHDTDDDHFLEVWTLIDSFIYPDMVERVAERLKIDIEEFADPDRPDRQ